ncbi:hypothetical protein DICPUDRAFT_25072 [Dictyostelium purpureum]|uniref:Aminotransferase class I/classII large domain-containing protein n=1 Tax=Dictyostelium purpureum TaxID=5786 RepID=F0Z6E9_DICPU|nr:uncharacterized protein DICPUDRAFT_25072 [Dictyostelium purpureum]EGC40476.1 hypothetical protein DICPUDRAFT_25072 [Dictyostelium purpureum]|eukprot:XP_003283023.1 hypothetical protein DICPUDRAFT_25072 [Dictyostelium purpureum]
MDLGFNVKEFSKNGLRVLNTPSCNNKISMAHYTAMSDLYDPKTNKNGYISLGIAENVLSFDVMNDKLKHDPNFCQKHTQYCDLGGFVECRKAVADLLQNYIFKTKPQDPKNSVTWNQVLVSNGATPLLENLFNLFCDEGECAIIPSPLFPNFIPFANQRFGVKVIPAKTEVYDRESNELIDFKIDLDVFDELYRKNKVKMVVLNNPNNPTGFIFPSNEIKKVVDWCRKKRVHLLSDEIYALSIFDHHDEDKMQGVLEQSNGSSLIKTNSFYSLYDICKGDMGDYCHIVSGFSKDFCINGFRAGYFYSQNPNVLKYMLVTSNYYCCSTLVQSALINIISDKIYLENYLKENQKRLKESYDFAVKYLNEFNIPFLKSSSGLFISLDLRACLPSFPIDENDKFSQEIKIWDHLFENKIIVNPGKLCYFNDPGFFRLIFTLPNDFVYEGIKRISEVYNKLKKT